MERKSFRRASCGLRKNSCAVLLNDPSAIHKNHARGDLFCKCDLMRHHDHRHTVFGQITHQRQHFPDHLRVQRGSRFVKQKHLRIHCQSTDDRNPLFLSAGKLLGISGPLFIESDPFQQFSRFKLRLFPCFAPGFDRRKRDILQNCQMRKQVEVLKHHPDIAAVLADFHAPAVDLLSFEQDFAGKSRGPPAGSENAETCFFRNRRVRG